jgi:LEA14-like dessication related protein
MNKIILGLTALALATCASGPKNSGPSEGLSVRVSQVLPVNESLDSSAVEVVLTIENPTADAVTVEKVEFELNTKDVAGVIKGSAESGAAIGPGQSAELRFRQSVPFPESPEAYQAVIKRDEIPVELSGTLVVSGADDVRFERSTSVATPTLPKMIINDIQAARYGREGVDITMFLRLVNENMFAVLIEGATYTLTVQDKEVRSEQAGIGVRLVGGAAQEFPVSVVMDEKQFDKETLKTILASGRVSYRVEGAIELKRLTIPFMHEGEIQLAASEE